MAREREPGKPLDNPRHEIAAQEYAAGATEADAYEAAGFEPNSGNASRLLKGNESVRERVEELLEQAAERAIDTVKITKELVLGLLLHEAINAKSDGARVQALKHLGQSNVVGLFVGDDENDKPKTVPEICRAIAGDDEDLYRRLLTTMPLAPSEKQ